MKTLNLAVSSALFAMLVLPGAPAFALGEEGYPDWPCVQRRVPTVSAATMWAEPALDETKAGDWRKDPAISGLVKRLSQRRVTIEEAGRDIEKFAAPLSDAEKLEKLPLVFQGVLQSINEERAAIIDGIERFTRKQRALANEVRETRAEVEAHTAENACGEQNEDAAQKLEWETRIHREREKTLEFVCESPTLLEQRAFELAREIQNFLP